MELPLTHHELYRQIGIDPPRGVLLYGAPGTGKTMLAKAVAHHTTAAFIRVVGSEFVQKYLGEVGPAGLPVPLLVCCLAWGSWDSAAPTAVWSLSETFDWSSPRDVAGTVESVGPCLAPRLLRVPRTVQDTFLLVDHSTLTKRGWPARGGNHMSYPF